MNQLIGEDGKEEATQIKEGYEKRREKGGESESTTVHPGFHKHVPNSISQSSFAP